MRLMGKLKNGNPSGDPNSAPRCGAHSRRTGNPCKAPAMKNGRCRMHGGKSTGAKTKDGIERARKANLIHGRYSAEAIQARREGMLKIRELRKRARSMMRVFSRNYNRPPKV